MHWFGLRDGGVFIEQCVWGTHRARCMGSVQQALMQIAYGTWYVVRTFGNNQNRNVGVTSRYIRYIQAATGSYHDS